MLNLFRRRSRNNYIGKSRKKEKSGWQDPAGVRKKNGMPSSSRSVVSWIFGLGLGLLLFLGVGMGLFQIYNYLTTSSYFNIKDISVSGVSHLSQEDILELCGLKPGMNSLTVNISEVEQKLYGNPWIASVSVKRTLPDSFEIYVQEHAPTFWVLINGVLHYANKDGYPIAPVQTQRFISLPILEILEDGEPLRPNVGKLLLAMQDAQLPIDVRLASVIRVSASRGIEIVLGGDSLSLCIQPDDWTANLARLHVVLKDLARRGELKSTREIWSADGNVWVVPRSGRK